jgi:hypothetical protein
VELGGDGPAGELAERDGEEPAPDPVGRELGGQRRRQPRPEQALAQHQRQPGGAPGAERLRAPVEPLDLRGRRRGEQRGDVGNPFQPEPGARGAVDAEIGEQLLRTERRQEPPLGDLDRPDR